MGDKVVYTVAEVRKGKAVPYPNQKINRHEKGSLKDCFVSVQSVVVDPKDRLWVLDTGSIQFGPATYGGTKIVGIDLKTNQVFKTILFPEDVALKNTYLNDVRFDLRRGTEGFAFITDSGANAIIVVDLASGKSWRRLADHATTKPVAGMIAIVEGRPLLLHVPNQKPFPLQAGADGIAISGDGSRVYYCPLTSRHLYSVSVDALIDSSMEDEKVAETVKDHGYKGGGSDGLESDTEGRIYLTDYEHNAILGWCPMGASRRLPTTRGCCGPIPFRWPTTVISISPPTRSKDRRSTGEARTPVRNHIPFSASRSMRNKPVALR